jgi:hypothetical protein
MKIVGLQAVLLEASTLYKYVINNDQWRCGYCHRKGGLMELKHWLQELKTIKD